MVLTSVTFKISKWPRTIDLIKGSIIFFSMFVLEGLIIWLDNSMSQLLAGILLVSFFIVPGIFGLVFIPRKVTLEIEKEETKIKLGRNPVVLNPTTFTLKPKGHTDTPWGTMDWSIRFSNNGKKYILMKSVPQGKEYKLSKEYIEYAAFHQQLLDLENSFKEKVSSNEN